MMSSGFKFQRSIKITKQSKKQHYFPANIRTIIEGSSRSASVGTETYQIGAARGEETKLNRNFCFFW